MFTKYSRRRVLVSGYDLSSLRINEIYIPGEGWTIYKKDRKVIEEMIREGTIPKEKTSYSPLFLLILFWLIWNIVPMLLQGR